VSDQPLALPEDDAASTRPAAMCHGPGHVIRYGNPAFVAAFGKSCMGMPAREALVSLPPDAFLLLDVVLAKGRPYARWIRFAEEEWRMTAAPRIDPSGEVYGVSFYLRSRRDLAVAARERPDEGAATES
jgi:hypothetical protein